MDWRHEQLDRTACAVQIKLPNQVGLDRLIKKNWNMQSPACSQRGLMPSWLHARRKPYRSFVRFSTKSFMSSSSSGDTSNSPLCSSQSMFSSRASIG